MAVQWAQTQPSTPLAQRRNSILNTRPAHYCDYAATAPIRPEAREAMLAALAMGGNPSSIHGAGRKARALVEDARDIITTTVGASSRELVFTSGGTEACNLMVLGAMSALAAKDAKPPVLLVSGIEHDAVAAAAEMSGITVETIPTLSSGSTDIAWLQARFEGWDVALYGTPIVALMLANNETGVIQPVREAADMVHSVGGVIAVDAVQALGKTQVHLGLLGADYIAVSGHKVGGPMGIGALIVRDGAPFAPRQFGGGQERGSRSGTENVAGIAGFAAALKASIKELPALDALAAQRDALENHLRQRGDVVVFGADARRLPGITCFGREGFAAATQVMALDLAGVMVSAGAACSSGKVRSSKTLNAMGVDAALVGCAIRASFGWGSSEDDFDALANAWLNAATRASPRALNAA